MKSKFDIYFPKSKFFLKWFYLRYTCILVVTHEYEGWLQEKNSVANLSTHLVMAQS